VIQETIIVGGSWREPGNAGPVSEFHIALDPEAARLVLHADLHPLLIPLDATRKLIFSPADLLEMPNPHSRTCQFLRQIVPYGIRASSNLYGIEGFHLKDVLGIVAAVRPDTLTREEFPIDVETRGQLTRGMTVIDARPNRSSRANARLVTNVSVAEVRHYIQSILRTAA
jgi:inosine-uridine nucleoside N-ribohydrolase